MRPVVPAARGGPRRPGRPRAGAAAELCAVAAGLVVLIVVPVLLLIAQATSLTRGYDRLLDGPVAAAAAARDLRAVAAAEQRAGRPDPAAARLQGRLERLADAPAARADLRDLRTLRRALGPALAAARAGDPAAADRVRTLAARQDAVLARLAADLDAAAAARSAALTAGVEERQRTVGLLVPAGVVVLLVVLGVVVSRVVRPIQHLARATRAARDELSLVAERVRSLPPGHDLPRPAPLRAEAGGDLADLASAVTGLRDVAVRLLVDEQARRHEAPTPEVVDLRGDRPARMPAAHSPFTASARNPAGGGGV